MTQRKGYNESTGKGHNHSALLTHDNTICLPSGDTASHCFSGSSASRITQPRFSQLLPCPTVHTCKRDATGEFPFEFSELGVFWPLLFQTHPGPFPHVCYVFNPNETTCTPPSTKLLNYPSLCKCYTSLYQQCPSLSHRTVNKHINAFWVPDQAPSPSRRQSWSSSPTPGVGRGGDLSLRESVHWVLQSNHCWAQHSAGFTHTIAQQCPLLYCELLENDTQGLSIPI